MFPLARDPFGNLFLTSQMESLKLAVFRWFHFDPQFVFHLVKNILHFPLLVLKGIYHWTYFHFFPGGLSKWRLFIDLGDNFGGWKAASSSTRPGPSPRSFSCTWGATLSSMTLLSATWVRLNAETEVFLENGLKI